MFVKRETFRDNHSGSRGVKRYSPKLAGGDAATDITTTTPTRVSFSTGQISFGVAPDVGSGLTTQGRSEGKQACLCCHDYIYFARG